MRCALFVLSSCYNQNESILMVCLNNCVICHEFVLSVWIIHDSVSSHCHIPGRESVAKSVYIDTIECRLICVGAFVLWSAIESITERRRVTCN